MTQGFEELASVDGTITPTAAATIGLKDDGLYRGDGAFEVIRLYEGKPFALVDHLDRLERSAAAIELSFDRGALEGEIEALLAQAGPVEGQMRLIVTRGGRRIAATEPIPPHPETVGLASVTYCPTVILNGVKSLSYAANMQATRIAKGQGADEARPDPPRRDRAGAAHLLGLLGLPGGRAADAGARRRGAGVDHPRPDDQGAAASKRGPSTSTSCGGASEAFLASTTREIQAVSSVDGRVFPAAPGPRTQEAQAAFAETLGKELREL